MINHFAPTFSDVNRYFSEMQARPLMSSMTAATASTSPRHCRRSFLRTVGLGAPALLLARPPAQAEPPLQRPHFGLVTYQWAKDWDLPTLLKNCEAANLLGVELRSTHAHGVEPSIGAAKRREIKKRFDDSPVICLGPGSNERFDDPDPAVVKKAIAATREFLQLSQDIGGSGVKVKPDRFHEGVEKEKTIAQIGAALRELAAFGADLGQEVRLEVHGQLSPPHYIEQVIRAADHPNAKVCWNCNQPDLDGAGLEANFALLRPFFGATCHIHDLTGDTYPHAQFLRLLADSGYSGWALLEEGKVPEDPARALFQQRQLFDQLIATQ